MRYEPALMKKEELNSYDGMICWENLSFAELNELRDKDELVANQSAYIELMERSLDNAPIHNNRQKELVNRVTSMLARIGGFTSGQFTNVALFNSPEVIQYCMDVIDALERGCHIEDLPSAPDTLSYEEKASIKTLIHVVSDSLNPSDFVKTNWQWKEHNDSVLAKIRKFRQETLPQLLSASRAELVLTNASQQHAN